MTFILILAISQFCRFSGLFWPFSHVKKGKYKMPKKQQKMASIEKNARKQTHSKIQFYIGMCVTSFDFVHFLLWWSKSTYPNVQPPWSGSAFSSNVPPGTPCCRRRSSCTLNIFQWVGSIGRVHPWVYTTIGAKVVCFSYQLHGTHSLSENVTHDLMQFGKTWARAWP